ncbi:unnamed protein product [Vicia faba]|uniref:Reverse transcriptase zinc-binding domain-containing protein n=1 Tax=Vicia faba TaxID=3906 RepID=A0AAV0Z0L8_VICFA|nr:unnamed protein product [Vicia faba]
MDNFSHISIANFKFKIISKTFVDRLSRIMIFLVSKEHKGFIKRRNIKDYLCLAYEVANLLDRKTLGGNTALKVDITKAFDTINWSFLIKVLELYGFNNTFCHWISTILESSFVSIAFSSSTHGYFPCKSSNIFALRNLFQNYSLASGQSTNASKFTIYCDSISNRRTNHLTLLTGFNRGCFPFTYLGVPISKDSMVWNYAVDGMLSMKEAYRFKYSPSLKLGWVGKIWNSDISPSKSLLAWRLLNDKIPSDDALQICGCSLCSMCNICKNNCESTSHILSHCPYAVEIWRWFRSLLNPTLMISSVDNIWVLCHIYDSPQGSFDW